MIIAATDGSSLGNPGAGGWCWYLSPECWRAGGFTLGTNNQAELMAVADLLTETATIADDLLIQGLPIRDQHFDQMAVRLEEKRMENRRR